MIYIISHKKVSLPSLPFYRVLAVGAKQNLPKEADWYSVRDDSADDGIRDDISDKNKTFCELTGVYWLWKHCQDDIIGICHYRRFFTRNKKWKPDLSTVLTEKEIRDLLQNNGIVLPTIHKFGVTVLHYLFFKYKENQQCMEDMLRNIVKEKYPEYIAVYDEVMGSYMSYTWNMMICSRENYNSYCKWLFDILFEFEKRFPTVVDFNTLNPDQKRVYGFISERLLTVWVKKNQLRVVEKPIIFTEEDRSLKGQIAKWAHFNVYYFREGTPLYFINKIFYKITGKAK